MELIHPGLRKCSPVLNSARTQDSIYVKNRVQSVMRLPCKQAMHSQVPKPMLKKKIRKSSNFFYNPSTEKTRARRVPGYCWPADWVQAKSFRLSKRLWLQVRWRVFWLGCSSAVVINTMTRISLYYLVTLRSHPIMIGTGAGLKTGTWRP